MNDSFDRETIGRESSAPHDVDSDAGASIPLARPAAPILARPAGGGDPMLLKNLTGKRVWAHLGILFIATLAYQLAITIVLFALGEVNEEGAVDSTVGIVATIVRGVILVAVVVVMMRSAGCSLAAIGLRRRRLGRDALLGPAVAAASFGVAALTSLSMYLLWPAGIADLQENPERIREMLPRLSPLAGLALMTSISVYEEVVFRGVLLTHVRRLTGRWLYAVPISAGLFSALHVPEQGLAAALALFTVAVAWSLVTIWRRSLVPAIIGHCLFNSVQYWVLTSQLGPA